MRAIPSEVQILGYTYGTSAVAKKGVEHYNIMGPVKAALEISRRHSLMKAIELKEFSLGGLTLTERPQRKPGSGEVLGVMQTKPF